MTYLFELPAIQANLEGLDEVRRIAFGTLLLERALPGYFQFQLDTGSAGGAVLRAALAQCWASLEANTRNGTKYTSVEACERSLPDSEDYSSPYTSAAIDTANIACCVLEYLESGKLNSLMEAVEARWDTFYLFILNGTDIEDEEVLHHPLMQEELRYMHEDITFLQTTTDPTQPLHLAVLLRVNQLDYRKLRLELESI
jgi:uncharacterized protein YjaG (DUF416 family)